MYCLNVASTIIAYYDVIHIPFLFSLLCRKSVLKVELLKDQNLRSHLLLVIIPCRSSGKKLIKYQANSSCVIMSVILMTTLFYKALILQGEI